MELIKTKHIIWCLIAILGLASSGFSQDWSSIKVVSQRESDFNKALAFYKSNDYQDALAGFESLASSRDLHQFMTGALLMTGKSLYQLGRFNEAVPYFDRLIATFPKSDYIDDAYFARATCYYRQEQYTKAVSDLLWVADWSAAEVMSSKSMQLAVGIMRSKLALSDVRSLLPYSNGENSAAAVTMELARKEIAEGAPEKAAAALQNYKKKYDSKKYAAKIDQLLKESESSSTRPVKVGVILPLTGYYAEEGAGILRGIKFAQQQARGQSSIPIQLMVRDSESNMVKALHEIKDLVKNEKVRAVIGELESGVTAGIGALASLEQVPVIAPAATENDLTVVGETIFQLNSNLEIKGQALAEYAFNILGLRNFATLAPADEYGQQLTNSFTSKIDQLGGRIIAQSWYYGSPEDLSRQFKAIRDAAFDFSDIDVGKLIHEAEEKGKELDEKDISVHAIDAIFFPVYADNIKYVAPQFALSNIRAQILGGEYWDDLETLLAPQVQPYVNGAIFVSDYFPDEANREFRNFRTEFRLKMKRTPERWEAFGFDAFNLLSGVMNQGAKMGPQIGEKLTALSDYPGIKGRITFKDNRRVNKEVNVLQFLNGRIVKQEVSR